MTDERVVRYRRLAMKEANPETAKLLRLLADQAEQGVLHPPAAKPKPVQPAAIVSE